MNRRSFLQGILAAGVAPAFIGSKVLMPIKELSLPEKEIIVTSGNQLLTISQITKRALIVLQEQINLAGIYA